MEFALVPYVGDQTGISQDQENSSKKPNYKSIALKAPYLGLSNQGATCYMNSILQALFMTPEFRKKIYEWRYNEEEHGARQDCIPYQLQKLFAKLQLQYTNWIETRGLTKSFQWESANSFQQHDAQEFLRVLFDAIDILFKNTPQENFLNDLYEGSIINYVKCQECGHESQREETFLDLGLTVKNIWDKIYNETLEKALQIYLKPEFLEGNNQYFCEKCQKKVNAKKGSKFLKLPKVLCLIVNRFTFDVISLQRIKLNDRVSFPFVLNMNNYINGYDEIKNKYPEESDPNCFAETFQQQYTEPITISHYPEFSGPPPPAPPLLQNRTNSSTSSQSKKELSVNIKKPNAKASSQTKAFLDEIRKQGKGQKRNNQIDIVISSKNEEEIAQGNTRRRIDEEQITEEVDINTTEQQSSDKPDTTYYVQNNEKFSIYDLEQINIVPPPPPPLPSDISKILSLVDSNNVDIKQERAQIIKENENKCKIAQQEIEKQIEGYLNDGPLVYELFSILVHSGGAYGGHYYAFIKSSEDSKWYNFNDSSVTIINPDDIPDKVFGGHGKPQSAYMLFYRQVDSNTNNNQQQQQQQENTQIEEELNNQNNQEDNEKPKIKLYNSPYHRFPKISENEIPEYLKSEILKEIEQKEIELENMRIASENFKVKVYYQLQAKDIPVNIQDTFQQLTDKCIEAFNLQQINKNNIRLRGYAPSSDSKLESYDDKITKTLDNLKIYSTKTLCIEVKQDNEIFEEYCSDSIVLNICVWKPNLETLDPNQLDLLKIMARRQWECQQLLEKIHEVTQIPLNVLRVYKRVKTAGLDNHEIINTLENYPKTLNSLRIIENSILYVESISEEENGGFSKWIKEFELDQNKLTIRYNIPSKEQQQQQSQQPISTNIEYEQSLVLNSFDNVQTLKEKVSQKLNIPLDEFIMKRGGKQGIELKDLHKSLSGSGFVNYSTIYIEYGIPTKVGEYRLVLSLATQLPEPTDKELYEFQDIGELSISAEDQPDNLIPKILIKLQQKGINNVIDKQIRIRERHNERLGKIYKNKPMKSQGLYDKRAIAVEIISNQEHMLHDLPDKIHQIIIKIWNSQTYELSNWFEVFVDRTQTLKSMGEAIYTQNQQIIPKNMVVCKYASLWTLNSVNLVDSDWVDLNDDVSVLGSTPFFLQSDGQLFIIRDRTIPIREMSKEEAIKIGYQKREKFVVQHSDNKYRQPQNRQTEKGLKIVVKKKEDLKQSENSENNQAPPENSQKQQPDEEPVSPGTYKKIMQALEEDDDYSTDLQPIV